MSSNSDFYEDFSSLSSPASLASGESWQDIQEELPNVPQAGDSPKLFHSEKTQEQELDDISHDTDDLSFSPGEDSTLPCPADGMEANVQAAGTIQHPMTQKLLSFSDGNIDLVIGNNNFRLHEYKLEEFTAIKDMIEVKRGTQGGEINASPLQITLGADVDDVCNTLSILYSPVYATKTHNFGVDVLKSTLRFATQFQHPAFTGDHPKKSPGRSWGYGGDSTGYNGIR